MGSQIATAYIGVMITPPLFGLVSYLFTAKSLPVFTSILYIIMVVSILEKIKSEGKYNKEV